MGRIVHKQLIVTSMDATNASKVHKLAKTLVPDQVTKIMVTPVNHHLNFMVGSSGSKLGWQDAKDFDNALDKIVSFIQEANEARGFQATRFAEIVTDEDQEWATHVLRAN